MFFDNMFRVGFFFIVVIYNIFIYGYTARKYFDRVMRLFDLMMESECEFDEYIYTEMIDGFCKAGNLERVFFFFYEMSKRGL